MYPDLLQWLLILSSVGAQLKSEISINGPDWAPYTFVQPRKDDYALVQLQVNQPFAVKWSGGDQSIHLKLLKLNTDYITATNIKFLADLNPWDGNFTFFPSTDQISTIPYKFVLAYHGGYAYSGQFLVVDSVDVTTTMASLSDQSSYHITIAGIEAGSTAPRVSQNTIPTATSNQGNSADESQIWLNTGPTQSQMSMDIQVTSMSVSRELPSESLESATVTVQTGLASSGLLSSQVTYTLPSFVDPRTTILYSQIVTSIQSIGTGISNSTLSTIIPSFPKTPDIFPTDTFSNPSSNLSSTTSGGFDAHSATSTRRTLGSGPTLTSTTSTSDHPSSMSTAISVLESPLRQSRTESDAPRLSTIQHSESLQDILTSSQATTTSVLVLSLSDSAIVWTSTSLLASYIVPSTSSSFSFPYSSPSLYPYETLSLDQHTVPKTSDTRIPELIPAIVISFVTVASFVYVTSTPLPLNNSIPSSSQSSTSLGTRDPNMPLVMLAIFAFFLVFSLILCFWLYLRTMRTQQYQSLPTTVQVTTSPSSTAPTDVLVELPPAYGMLHSDHVTHRAIPPLQEQVDTSSSSRRSSVPYSSSQIWELGLPSEQAPSLRSAEHLSGQQNSSRGLSRRLSSASRRSIRKSGGLPSRRASYHLQVPITALGRRGVDQIGRAASDQGIPTRRDL